MMMLKAGSGKMGKEKMSDWEDEIGAEWLGVRLDVTHLCSII